jgi:hypothetical protein
LIEFSRRHVGDVDREPRLRRRRNRGSRSRRVRDCSRHLRRELVDLALCLYQHGVAQIEVAGDLAGANGAVGDQIGRRPIRSGERNRAQRALGRIRIPLPGRGDSPDGSEVELAGLVLRQQRGAGGGEDRHLIVASQRHANVQQFRDLVDGLVALILERGGGAVVGVGPRDMLVDVGNLLQGIVDLLHVVGNGLIRLGAKSLNARGCAVQLLHQGLGRIDGCGLDQNRGRAGGERLHRGRELVEYPVQTGIRTWLTVDLLQLLIERGLHVGIGAARRFRA